MPKAKVIYIYICTDSFRQGASSPARTAQTFAAGLTYASDPGFGPTPLIPDNTRALANGDIGAIHHWGPRRLRSRRGPPRIPQYIEKQKKYIYIYM